MSNSIFRWLGLEKNSSQPAFCAARGNTIKNSLLLQTNIPSRLTAAQIQPVRFLAHVISIVFHPLLIASYVIGFLLYLHPSLFSGMESKVKAFRFLAVFFSSFLMPAFAVFLLWRLKFVPSMMLRSAKDRIIPYVMVMVFYFWIWYVYHNLPENPAPTEHFLLGSFLAICAAWMCNIFFTISMHSTAMGGLLCFFLLFSFQDAYASGLYLSAAFLVAGLVCTARLIVSQHSVGEIYAGLVVGALTQWIAWQF